MSQAISATTSSNRLKRLATRLPAVGLVIFLILLFFTVLLPAYQARNDAKDFLQTACIAAPGGDILPTVTGGDYRYRNPPQLRVDPATGEKRMSGFIYALDGRELKGFKVSEIKFVPCPAGIQR
jgi:hypothetical protein